MAVPEVFKRLEPFIEEILQDAELASADVAITCRTLTTQEAIGSTGRDDFPLQKGKESLLQAEINGYAGQAYTDMPGQFSGTLHDALTLPPVNNFHRAVIIATLNAVLAKLGKASCTIHCKDTGPRECSQQLVEKITEAYGYPRIAVIGLQPTMVEQLSRNFSVRVFDLDPDNVGKDKYGVSIESGEQDLKDIEDWCDLFLVTGSTVVNGTLDSFLNREKPILFYGTSVAGTAGLLGLDRFCPIAT